MSLQYLGATYSETSTVAHWAVRFLSGVPQQKTGGQGKPAFHAINCISQGCGEVAETLAWADLNPPPAEQL